jgi:hypothetical protein
MHTQVDTTVLGLSEEEAKAKPFIASMGIYVFKKGVLGECWLWAACWCVGCVLCCAVPLGC